MGDPVLITGAAGVVIVLLIWLGPGAVAWLRRYHRAHGYEAEFARHVLGVGPGKPLDPELHAAVTYGTVSFAPVSGRPPWGPLTGQWLSELEANGQPAPEWAKPEADRVGAYGMNSGSAGSDYHGGELPTAGGDGTRRPLGTGDASRWGAGSEAYGPTGRPPLNTGEAITWAITEADNEAWTRLLEAWADDPAASSVATGGTEAASSPNPVSGRPTGPMGGAKPAPGPAEGAPPPGPGWAPSKLATRFDVELAADAAAYMRDQDKSVAADMAARLERLERWAGVRL